MTIPAELDVVVASDDDTANGSYVDWAAIIAGIVFASALSILFLTFGSAVGLSFTNFNARPDVSPIWLAIAAASWLLWVQISSFMAGGYLTGRLRKRHADATEDESDVRDGAHGVLVWAGALVIGAVLAVSGIGATVSAIGSAASTFTTAASNVAGGAAENLDPNAYYVDSLFRAAPAAGATDDAAAPADAAAAPAADTSATPATTTEPVAETTPAPAAPASGAATAEPTAAADMQPVRDEAGRIFMQGALGGGVSDEDRTYLAQLVADNTGLSDEEATARVDEVMTAMDTAATEAAEAAEAARKTAVLAAFLTAASLLVSAVGAFWAAQMGGNHRDKNVVFPGAFRRL
jgi:hypothetical protein